MASEAARQQTTETLTKLYDDKLRPDQKEPAEGSLRRRQGALRLGGAHSLHWQDCELIVLNDKDRTEAVHMRVPGKH